MIKELEYPAYVSATAFPRVSWGAIVAGATAGLALLATMTSLGAGLGVIDRPWRGLAISFSAYHAVWMTLSSVASFYAGGWIAGRLTPIARVSESVIHGFLAWAAATAVLAFVFSPSYAGGLGWIAGAVGPSPAAVGPEAFDQLTAARISGEMGILGRWAFLTLAAGGAAALFGARAGTRVLRPVPMAELRRERVGV